MKCSSFPNSKGNSSWELWEVGWGGRGTKVICDHCLHIIFLPFALCSTFLWNSLLKYLRTVRCLQAPWSLQREELIQIQLNKFHLKWEDPTLGQKALHEVYSSSTTASWQYLSNHRILKYSTLSIKNAWNNKAKWLCASGYNEHLAEIKAMSMTWRAIYLWTAWPSSFF